MCVIPIQTHWKDHTMQCGKWGLASPGHGISWIVRDHSLLEWVRWARPRLMLGSHIGKWAAGMAMNKKLPIRSRFHIWKGRSQGSWQKSPFWANPITIPLDHPVFILPVYAVVWDETQYIRGEFTAKGEVPSNLRWRCIIRIANALRCVAIEGNNLQ